MSGKDTEDYSSALTLCQSSSVNTQISFLSPDTVMILSPSTTVVLPTVLTVGLPNSITKTAIAFILYRFKLFNNKKGNYSPLSASVTLSSKVSSYSNVPVSIYSMISAL